MPVEALIDAGSNPEAKMRLLSGQLNQENCPNCGTVVSIASPILYHDAEKQLLITYVPMELNLPKQQQEKAVGDLMRELTSSLPQEAIKGYIFQPKQALTMQGLIDQVLQADGITPEMIEQQRQRAKLIEQFARTSDEDLPALIAQHDAELDTRFLQLMTMMAQQLVQNGQRLAAEQIVRAQQAILELASVGKTLQAQAEQQEAVVRMVAEELDALGANATRADLLNLALRYQLEPDAEQRIQALVGLIRPALDYQFFQELTLRIGQAPTGEREALEGLRENLTTYAAQVDRQTQAMLQNAVQFLQVVINSPDPDALLRENMDMIDDTLIAVLTRNIQEAERRGDAMSRQRLQMVYDKIMALVRDNMQPELRFINELLAVPSDEEALAMLPEGVQQYGEALVNMIDGVEDILASRGETALVERLALVREDTLRLLGAQ
jgi:hypothetical protein